MNSIRVIDSHTGGEPTRVVVNGGPDLGGGPAVEQLKVLRESHDRYRSAIVREPRGSDVLVGAWLCEPADRSCATGVIFFNNVGYLGMCGHGAIGVMVTLAHLGRIQPGAHRLETPVGTVTATLNPDGSVAVENVPSHRAVKSLTVDVPGLGPVTGDLAWGGNWFFLIERHGQALEASNARALVEYAGRVRRALNAAGHPEVDHVELFGPPVSSWARARNFVLCPGGAYDRSPCGTGTSAKLACLAADGKLEEDEAWVQESLIGSLFTARYRWRDRAAGVIVPTLTGSAFVNAEVTLLLDERDPFCWGID